MNQLTNQLVCVCMRSGIEVWLEAERAANLAKLLASNGSQFIECDGQLLNRADIVGIFSAASMEDLTRRKNGQWFCRSGGWHDRGQKCECASPEDKALIQKREEAIKACGKCMAGYTKTATGMAVCNCVGGLVDKK